MSKQPEALRLSEWLDRRTNIMLQDRQAAAELRRLHALNAELLEALKFCAAVCAGESMSKSSLVFALEKARTAMEKSEP